MLGCGLSFCFAVYKLFSERKEMLQLEALVLTMDIKLGASKG